MIRPVVILVCALVLGGCSQSGPAAPLRDAQRINTLTGDISTACGLLTQLSAFPPPPRHQLITLRASAEAAAERLTAIDRSHPHWRFDGVALPTIINQARTMLGSCGLTSVAEQLKPETATR